MLNVGLVGCTGKLGKVIMENILNDAELNLSYSIGRKGNHLIGKDISEIIGGINRNIPILDEIQLIDECDVFVDCTSAESFINQNAKKYHHKCKPIVIATTGFSDDDFTEIKQLAKQMPILFSANYSISLYSFIESLKVAAKNINSKTDIHIIELHHNQKKDAPSGTALRIQEFLCKANSNIKSEEIQISSIRGGNIFGEHRVIFATQNDEVFEYSHSVSSRESFATGVIESVKWLSKQAVGYYTMDSFLKEYIK